MCTDISIDTYVLLELEKLPLVKEIGFMLLKQAATSLKILKTKKITNIELWFYMCFPQLIK